MKQICFPIISRMKFYRKLSFFAAILLLMFVSAACNDILDTPAENRSYTEDTDYTLSENIIRPTIGAYVKIYEMGWECIPLISVRGDDVNAGGKGDQQDYEETDYFRYNKDYWMYNSLWEGMYSKIYNCYSALDEIELFKAAGANSTIANQYAAEVKTLSAFLLFQTARVWGNVFIPETSDPTDLYQMELSSKDQVMQHLSELMDGAIPALPAVHPKERTDIPGGVTKFTALAVKALANLEMKNYQAVADATGEIIKSGKFTLESDYYELFKVNKGKLNQENIFEFQYTNLGAASGGTSYLFGFFGPQGWTPKVSGKSDGWGFYEPSLKYIKFMLDRGETVRLETTVLFTNTGIDEIKKDAKYANLPAWLSNTTRSGDVINNFPRAMFSSGKYYLPSDQLHPNRNDYGNNKNFTCIRYAEILLMYAEALANGASGSAGSAADAVNLVRTRAGLTPLASVTIDQVIDEKYAELGTEWGTRYYDMLRYERYNELTYDGRSFSQDKAFLPYPQNQVDLLPILKGNQ